MNGITIFPACQEKNIKKDGIFCGVFHTAKIF
jgi:hypothetical protein